jgi:hypothetical protein
MTGQKAALCLMMALGGCVAGDGAAPTVTPPMTPTVARGETVLATAGPIAGSADVQVTSARGWQCRGQFLPEAAKGAAMRFPLDCSDDVTATALMQVNPEDGRAAMLFSRKDGSSGQAVFAIAR